MIRNVQIATCPNCGNRATVYTINSGNAEKHGIGCAANGCGVVLPVDKQSFDNALYQWNHGLNLKQRNGTVFYVDGSKHRRMITTEVDA